MGAVYATVDDIKAVGKSLTAAQEESAPALLEQASAKLRLTGKEYGVDINERIREDASGDYALAVKSVVVDAVSRAMDVIARDMSVASQGTESIGAYSLTTTYANAGASLYFTKNELRLLGLIQQVYGAIELWATGGEPPLAGFSQ